MELAIWVQARDPEPLMFIEHMCPGCSVELENAVVRTRPSQTSRT